MPYSKVVVMSEMGSAAYEALYCDEDGDVIGLDEVQLLDPLADRVPVLRELVRQGSPFDRFQATLVLAAWADEVGMDGAEKLMETAPGPEPLNQHRLTGQDTVLDDVAEALAVSLVEPSVDRPRVERLAIGLLERFDDMYFRSGLRRLVVKLASPALVDPVLAAIESSVDVGNADKASELLPGLAVTDPAAGWATVARFGPISEASVIVAANVADALAHVRTPDGRGLLTDLAQRPEEAVRRSATAALAAHDGS